MYGFDRLIKEMDEIAGRMDEEVIMQIGETAYEPKNAKYFRFASKEKMDGLYDDARVVVCHAGVGSILTTLEHGKPVIAVPRREKYGEHVDDHQLDIAREMGKEGMITVVRDVGELEGALGSVSTTAEIEVITEGELVKALKKYLEEMFCD
jgi:UDP-N-acetylglucosamine transferase subunit ALG13